MLVSFVISAEKINYRVYVRNEKYFDDNIVEMNFKGNMLFVDKDIFKNFNRKQLLPDPN